METGSASTIRNYAGNIEFSSHRLDFIGTSEGRITGSGESFGYEYFLYDAQLGRWHCQDPMEQFHSPYLAMGNDPVNGTDPTGMWFDPPPPRLWRVPSGEFYRTDKYMKYRVKVRGHWVDGWSFYINHLRALKNGQVWDGKLMLFRESISHPVDLLPEAYNDFDDLCEQYRMQWTQAIELEKQARRRELFEKKTLSEIFTLIQEIASGKKKEDEENVTEERIQESIAQLNAKIADAVNVGISFTLPQGEYGWPTPQEIDIFFKEVWEQVIVDEIVNNPQFSPESAIQLSEKLLSTPILTSNIYTAFGLKPIQVRIEEFDSSKQVITSDLYPPNKEVNDNGLPHYYNPGSSVVPIKDRYRFVIKYEILFPG